MLYNTKTTLIQPFYTQLPYTTLQYRLYILHCVHIESYCFGYYIYTPKVAIFRNYITLKLDFAFYIRFKLPSHHIVLTIECGLHLVNVETADGWSNQAIGAGCERGIESSLVRGQLINRLYLIEVERKLARNATVEPGLQIGGPVVGQKILAPDILLADTCNARIDRFAAVDVLHGSFPEEEIHVVPDVKWAHKVGFYTGERKKERQGGRLMSFAVQNDLHNWIA